MGFQSIPIFPAKDVAAALAFFRGLGFTVPREFPDSGYAIVQWRNVELHISGFDEHNPLTTVACAYFRADTLAELEEAYAQFAPTALKLRPITLTDCGMWEFSFVDADNNLLRMGAKA